ncbi:MAG: hypothetical protein C0417_11775 [Chlorobiaceae bacterium]|nr:hypothetical protein [Chlorobiaceae bacterium]
MILSIVITPYVIGFAEHIGAMDMPNDRKVHKYPIPRLGGIAIYISFFAALIFSLYLQPSIHPFGTITPKTGIMLVVSLTIVLILGIWDDLKQLSPGKKFIGQVFAASIVYFAGFRISAITSPMDLALLDLGIFDFPATVLWVVGITNAFNLIDGLDGLASGVAFIVAITIFLISFMKNDIGSAMLALLLAGAVLGFLRYNFNRARIFLGDSGSLFIGFTLAILSMTSSTKGSTAFSIIVPVLTLGLPIMDTMLAMTRRFLRSMFPDQKEYKPFIRKMLSIFDPDKGHIHHQLINLGLSHRKVVLLLYVVSVTFGVGAFAVTVTNTLSAIPILIAIGVATVIGVSQLKYKEMAVLRNGYLLPIYKMQLMNNTFFLGFLDIAFIIISFVSATALASIGQHGSAYGQNIFKTITLVSGIQLVIFYISGLYKGTFHQWGIGDILKILKVVSTAIIVTWGIFALFPQIGFNFNITIFIIDFYLLITLVMGTRISYQILNYFSKRGERGKKNVLIYGADIKGVLMLQEMVDDTSLQISPVGFLDDDPKLEGKRLNGYPIFGGHRKLERLINTKGISEVILSNDAIKPIVLKKLIDIARNRGIIVRKFKVRFEEVSRADHKSQVLESQTAFYEQIKNQSV